MGQCLRYITYHYIGGPFEPAQQLAEDLGLRVAVRYPWSGRRAKFVSNRINLPVNAEHILRRVDGG